MPNDEGESLSFALFSLAVIEPAVVHASAQFSAGRFEILVLWSMRLGIAFETRRNTHKIIELISAMFL